MDVIIGVDVGGTNTDAVVLSSDGQVKGKAKVLTSGVDLTRSVCQAVTKALNSVEGTETFKYLGCDLFYLCKSNFI